MAKRYGLESRDQPARGTLTRARREFSLLQPKTIAKAFGKIDFNPDPMNCSRICILTILSAILASSWASAKVRLVGSDLLGEVLRPAIEEQATRQEWTLEIDFNGTLNAQSALAEGRADVAILAIPDGIPPTEGVLSFPFAFEVTVVGVNELNPVMELTVGQLRDLFALRAKGESSDWGELEAGTQWAGRIINFNATRDRDHLNLELFRSLVLGPREMRVDVDYLPTRTAVVDQVGEDTNAIGLFPVYEEHPQVRLLFISATEQTQAYGPTEQSVFYGDYPLRLPYYIVYSQAASKEALELVRFLLGDEVAAVMKAKDYMPAPKTERGQFQMDLDFGG